MNRSVAVDWLVELADRTEERAWNKNIATFEPTARAKRSSRYPWPQIRRRSMFGKRGGGRADRHGVYIGRTMTPHTFLSETLYLLLPLLTPSRCTCQESSQAREHYIGPSAWKERTVSLLRSLAPSCLVLSATALTPYTIVAPFTIILHLHTEGSVHTPRKRWKTRAGLTTTRLATNRKSMPIYPD